MEQIILDIIFVLGYAVVASIMVGIILAKKRGRDAQVLRIHRRRGFFDGDDRHKE